LKGELTASSVGFRRDLRSREEEGDVAWLVGPTRQRGKERTGGTISGLILGRGWLLELGRKASRGPFSYFSLLYFFSFFYFPISFTDFAKMFPNQFKPLSEILQKSLQGFKSVGKQVFRIKTRVLIELWMGGQRFCLHKANWDLKINPLKIRNNSL
jgi:hypothetical protein